MNRVVVGVVLAACAPALGQAPAARLGAPAPPPATIRASSPDPFPDDGPLPPHPAARLGPITSARIGEVPGDASAEERYNWGVPRDRGVRATPVARNRGRSDDRDDWYRDEPPARGARLRNPAPGRRTGGQGGAWPPAPTPDGGPDPAWWPGRERELADLRDQFPAFGERNRDRLAFESDRDFDPYPSPITNPFLAEDPRSLTELRPIFMYQTVPSSHPVFEGGSLSFLGTQARVAFTDRFSLVLHKLGFLFVNPGTGPLGSSTGLAEVWLGPKFVFWRNPDTQTIAAAGFQLQFPWGSGSAFQDTGGTALVPYVSVGTEIARTASGTFRLINVTGYHIGTDDLRSDYLFDTLSLSWDVADLRTFYPMVELTWFHYTSDGLERPFYNFEGRDLINFGAQAGGHDLLTIAPGFRYKFSEALQMGVAAEFPVVGSKDLFNFRVTLDLIWRY